MGNELREVQEMQEIQASSKKATAVAIAITAVAVIYACVPEPTDAVPVAGWLDECGIGAIAINFINKARIAYERYKLAEAQIQQAAKQAKIIQEKVNKTYQAAQRAKNSATDVVTSVRDKQGIETVKRNVQDFSSSMNDIAISAVETKSSIEDAKQYLPRKRDSLEQMDKF